MAGAGKSELPQLVPTITLWKLTGNARKSMAADATGVDDRGRVLGVRLPSSNERCGAGQEWRIGSGNVLSWF
jgi:hypothetical protein